MRFRFLGGQPERLALLAKNPVGIAPPPNSGRLVMEGEPKSICSWEWREMLLQINARLSFDHRIDVHGRYLVGVQFL
jgi:hypothetical protein